MLRTAPDWRDIGCTVGNGGFSLRKIASALRVLEKKEEIFAMRPRAWSANRFLPYEDLFWAFCSTVSALGFHVPDVRTALAFSVGMDIGHAYRRMPAWMPFGCHGWSWVDYWFWKPLVEMRGYDLPEPAGRGAIRRRKRWTARYLVRRLAREKRAHEVIDRLWAGVTEGQRPVALWGWGKDGKEIFPLLEYSDVPLAFVFDKGRNATSAGGIAVLSPDFSVICATHLFILIATSKYEDDVARELELHALKETRDFLRYSTFVEMVADEYLQSFR